MDNFQNKKRIIFVLPTLSGGGQERIVSRLSFALDDSFYEKILVIFYQTKKDYPFKGKMIELKLPLVKGPLKFFTKIIFLLMRIYFLRKIKKNLTPDIVVSFGPEANVVNVFSNLGLKKIKTIVSIRTVESFHFKEYFFALKWYYNFILRLILKLSDKIIPNSEFGAQDLIKNFGAKKEKVFTIYNFFDIKNIEKESLEDLEEFERLFSEKKVIISVGRLEFPKGFQYLIEGFKEINLKFPETILLFLGEGNLKKKLENLRDKLNLKEKVFFLGFRKNPFKFLRKSFLFVLSSLREGFPNVLLEAMICQVPVIATDAPGAMREILSPNSRGQKINNIFLGEYGVLIPPKDPKAISEAISLFLNDEKLRNEYVKKGKKRALDFDQEKIINLWKKILN